MQTLDEEISASPRAPVRLTSGVNEAYQALEAGHLEKAESLYRTALQADEQNIDALLGLAAIAMQRIIAGSAPKRIVAIIAIDRIIAVRGKNLIISVSGIDRVYSGCPL